MDTKHILLLTDLSEEALRAFQPVANLARWAGAKLTLLHVIRVLTEVPPGSMLATPLAVGNPGKEDRDALAALEEQSRHLGSDLEVELEIRTGESVVREVVRFAEENDVGLIALSTHGRSGLRRLVLGSVAEGILRHSHVPVLAFPPREKR